VAFEKVYRTLYERVLSKIQEPENEQACWVYTGSLDRAGYGSISVRVGKRSPTRTRTHLVVWEHLNGPRAVGATIDHLCRNTSCCNPDHLQAVSREENTRLAWARRKGSKT